MRYDFLFDLVGFLKPSSIAEIGVHNGHSAEKMVRRAAAAGPVEYHGYDVWQTETPEFHVEVLNGKGIPSRASVEERLNKVKQSAPITFKLIEGQTSDTLWPNPRAYDFVFLDGDHRVESIQKDYDAVRNSRVVVFDDFYSADAAGKIVDIERFGCNRVVSGLDCLFLETGDPVREGGFTNFAIAVSDPAVRKSMMKKFPQLKASL